MQRAFRCHLQRPFSRQRFTSPSAATGPPLPTATDPTLQRRLLQTIPIRARCSNPHSPSSLGQSGAAGSLKKSAAFSACLFAGAHPAAGPSTVWTRLVSVATGGSSSVARAKRTSRGSFPGRIVPWAEALLPAPCSVRNGNSNSNFRNTALISQTACSHSLWHSARHSQHTPVQTLRLARVSRYHTSSSSSGPFSSNNTGNKATVSGVNALQTWRRPFQYPSSTVSSSETRSLATMPTRSVMQAAPGTAHDPAKRLQRSLAAVPHHTIKNEIKLRCTEFDHRGNVKTTAGEFLKSDLCQQHGLHARDLRKIDSSFNNQMPVILVRPEAILVNVGHIRALIKADLVVLFDSFGSTDSYNQSIFIYDLEEKLRMSTSAAGGMPFEFRALEAIFISVLTSLQSEMEVLVHFVTNLLAHLEESIDQNKLKELLQYSKKLSQFESKTLLIRDVFVEVLDQDDDLANMYLTEKKQGHPRTVDSHEEIEVLLESYLKQVEEIANTVSIVKQQMQSTEEIVNVILGANRNQLLLFELRIAMGTLGMSSGAIIASLYGMNLHNYLETNPHAFAIVGSTALGISMMVFLFCSRKLKMLAKGTT